MSVKDIAKETNHIARVLCQSDDAVFFREETAFTVAEIKLLIKGWDEGAEALNEFLGLFKNPPQVIPIQTVVDKGQAK